jgi:hypothetical protein
MEEEATIPGHYCILEGDGRTDRSYCVLLGGPAQKMTFFQVVQKSFLSVPIYCSRCKYDSLDFCFQKYCLEPVR